MKQQFAVWDKTTGVEVFRSEAFEPIVRGLRPRCALSQSGAVAMVYWPANVIAPRLYRIEGPGS